MLNLKNLFHKTTAFFTACIAVISMSFVVFAEHKDYSKQDMEKTMKQIISWKKSDLGINKDENLFNSDFVSLAGNPSADWYAIGIGRMGLNDNYMSYLAVLKNNIIEKYKAKQKLDPQKSTEWHRIALTLLALGGDPSYIETDSDGKAIDLIADGTYNRGLTSPIDAQGINGSVWGLIALDSLRYSVPESSADSRNDLIKKILIRQNKDGSFSLNAEIGDVDVTAMAITALAPYYNSEEKYFVNDNYIKTRNCIDKAIDYLSDKQSDDGGFSANIGLEATAQSIIALCSVGIDPVNDVRFIKNGCNLLDGLMKYKNSDGGFVHSIGIDTSEDSNSISGEQALLALVSLYRFQNDMRTLYDFRPEMTNKQKDAISNLEKEISKLSNDRKTVEKAFDNYMKIPTPERCYVKNYYVLAAKMEELGVENNTEFLSSVMNLNESGNGTVTDIFDQRKTDTNLVFNDDDLATYNSLPKVLTTKQYTTVLYLYDKLNNSGNLNDYKKILEDLEIKKSKIETIKKHIEKINQKILENLYPFDSITVKDKEDIESIYKEITALNSYDQKQILGFEDVLKAKTKIENLKRTKIITIITAGILIILVIILILRIRNYRIRKRENELFIEENDDW